MTKSESGSLRRMPSVTAVLNCASAELLQRFGHAALTDAIREAIEHARQAIRAGAALPTAEALLLGAEARLERRHRSGLRPLFNLTGTVLHTNLGRALLAEPAIEAAGVAMRRRGARVRS